MNLEHLGRTYDDAECLGEGANDEHLNVLLASFPYLLAIARAARDYTDPRSPLISFSHYEALREALDNLEDL